MYTVAELDQWMLSDFTIKGKYRTYSAESGDIDVFHLVKWGEVDDVPSPFGVISLVDGYGGEGKGDDYWVVIEVTSPDGTKRYFRRGGWYQSYSGGALDGPTVEVKPTERLVTFYE